MLIIEGSYYFVDKVKFKTRMQCHPLLEDQFRPIISDNYYESKLFWFELDQRQTDRLIALFSSSPILTTVSPLNRASSSLKTFQTINVREDSTNSSVFSSNISVTCPDSKKKWSSLFKVSPTVAKEDIEDFEKPTSELNLSSSNPSSYGWEEPSCTSRSSEEESKSCEAPTSGSGRQREIEEPEFFISSNEIDSSYFEVKVESEEYKSIALEVNLPYSNLKDVAENMEGNALSKGDEEILFEDTYDEDVRMHWERTANNSLGANIDVNLSSDRQLVTQVLEHPFYDTSLF